jgi:hypothetical protein
MKKYLRLFAALERIFGKGYVSRLMGKQSNVITLPDKQARKFLDTELNVMEASEGAVKKGIQDLETVISDTKRLSTLNDQELLTITNNAERLAVKVNPPAPPPAPTADVLSITTKVNKNKDPNVLIDEYNKNQTRLRLTDDEGGTAISYDEFRKLQSRNNEIEKTLESLNVKPALDEVKPEGIVIPFTKKPKESGIKSLKQEERSIDDYVDDAGGVNKDDPRGLDDFFDNPEDFATGGRVGMAGGGITALKSIIKFLAKNRGFGPTTGSKSLQELNPKQFGWKFNLLSPELKKSMEQNRLEYLENLSDAIKSDKKLLTDIKNMPKEWQEFMYKSANEGANQGRLDVYKKINIDDAISEIEQMKKNLEFKNLPGKEIKRRMNAEGGVSQGLDYLTGIERRGYAGGSILKTIGKKLIKKPKTETTSIDPIIDENVDLSKRGFLKGAAGVGAGIAAFGSGALKLAKKGAKEVKDLDVVFRKNYDGEYVDGTPTVFSEIIADIVPYTKKAKTFLEDMVKQKKVIKNNDGSYFVDVQDIHDMGGDIGVFKDIGNKFNYKTFKTDNYVDIEEIKDLRSYSSPLKNNPTYGPIDFEDDAAEYVADALQPKTAKEIIKERTDLIERKLKERGDFAGGGILKTIGKKLIKKPKKYKFTGEESLNDLFELERQGKITREDMNVYSPRYLEYLDAQIINKEKLYTPKEWEKTPEVLKNKMRGRIDPDWEEANFGEEFNWDQARSMEMKQQKQLQDFDITGRKKNAKGGLNYLMGL